jgi:ribose transport system permease protein
MILAIGMCFVMITGGIDLSGGSIISFSGVVMALVANALHLPAPLAVSLTLLVGVGIGAACGLVNGFFVVKLKLHGFMPTFCMMSIALGLAFLTSPRPIPLHNVAAFQRVGQGWTGVAILILAQVAEAARHTDRRSLDGDSHNCFRRSFKMYSLRAIHLRNRWK